MSDNGKDPLAGIGPLYRRNLARYLGAAERPAPAGEGLLRLEAAEGETSLVCWVDPESHTIVEASGRGGASPAAKALLAALADAMRGVTVQDAAEHAVIRVENLLRESPVARPVPGIALLQNADPAFRPLTALARGILAAYRVAASFRPGMNVEDVPSGPRDPSWGIASGAERLARVRAAIPSACPVTGVAGADVEVLRIDAGRKVTISFRGEVDARTQQRYMMILEQRLRTAVDGRLEVFLDPRLDANTKRRGQLPGERSDG